MLPLLRPNPTAVLESGSLLVCRVSDDRPMACPRAREPSSENLQGRNPRQERRQSLSDASANLRLQARLCRAKQFVNVFKRGIRVVIVILGAVLVHAIATDLVQNLANLVERRLPIVDTAGDFRGGLHERTKQAPVLRI